MGRLLDRVEDALAALAASLLVFTVVFVPLDVGSRYFRGAPITWVYEVTEYILLMVPCLAMAWLARHNGHVMIDVVTSRLSPRAQQKLGGAVCLLTGLACLLVAWYAAGVTLKSFQAKAIIENVLQTPQWLIYVCIPVGFGLTAIEFFRKGARSWNGG